MQFAKEHRYEVEGHTYVKRWNDDQQRFLFFQDTEPLTLNQWNEVVNRIHPMAQKADHPNPLVRWVERQRCQITSRLVRERPAQRVLDIGCESGHVTAALVAGAELGILADLDIGMLRRAKARAVNGTQCLAADVTGLPFRNETFDLIICTEVLEHLADPEAAVREMSRALAQGGRLVISVPNDLLIVRIKGWIQQAGLTVLLGPLSPGLALGHIQLFTKTSLGSILARHLTIRRLFFSWPFRLNLFAVAVPVDHLTCKGG